MARTNPAKGVKQAAVTSHGKHYKPSHTMIVAALEPLPAAITDDDLAKMGIEKPMDSARASPTRAQKQKSRARRPSLTPQPRPPRPVYLEHVQWLKFGDVMVPAEELWGLKPHGKEGEEKVVQQKMKEMLDAQGHVEKEAEAEVGGAATGARRSGRVRKPKRFHDER